jgi:molybdopterin molybdotransferase
MKVKREEAKRIILETCYEKPFEVVTLERAYGRVLAEDVYSPVDVPDEDKSAIDGYAFNAESVKELPAKLKIIGETAAGDTERKKVNVGEAVFVMTGGVIPEGANAAVRVEDVSVEGDYVVIDFPVEPGTLVNFKGSEIKKGEKVLEKGEHLDFRKVGLLANIGIYSLKVFQKPKVAVIVTGNEVLEPYEHYRLGTTRNSNYYILKGLLEREGAEVVYMGIARDDTIEMRELFEKATATADIVVTTGGVSKGRYDFVRGVVESLGFNVKFSMTNIRPGRPLVFATKEKKLFFGLPGYPTAMLVNTLEFLVPALRKLSGQKDVENRYLVAVAAEPLKSKRGRVDFIRTILFVEGGIPKIKPLGSQRTSDFRTMAKCNSLAIVEEEKEKVTPGESVKVLFF